MNKKRIRLMTQLAMFEKEHGKMLGQAGTCYRSDFLGMHLLKNFCRGTLAFLLGMMLWVCANSEEVLEKLNRMDVKGLGISIVISFGLFLALFLALTYLVYSIHFFQAEKRLSSYRLMLERLESEYEEEETRVRPRRRRSSERRQRGNLT